MGTVRFSDSTELGVMVRRERKRQRLTQQELADKAGVGITYVCNLENGKPTAELGKALQLLHSLGLDIFAKKTSAYLNVFRTKGACHEPVGVIDLSSRTFAYCMGRSFEGGISASLPLREEPYSEQAFRPYFEGLLPEGETRAVMAAKLFVHESDYLALLEECALECVGDVVFLPSDVPLDLGNPDDRLAVLDLSSEGRLGYDALDAVQMSALFASPDAMVESSLTSRLSLAGVQGKTGLAHPDSEPLGEGWGRPVGGAASTHILKVSGLRDLPALECICMKAAEGCGVLTASADLLNFKRPVVCVKRYDRKLSKRGSVKRLHQEDMCQALGLLPQQKYAELPGGTYSTLADFLESHTEHPSLEIAELARVACFNYLIGNCDNHLKNTSLLYSPNWETALLAPAYDLVSTTYFPRFSREMAAAIGGQRMIDEVRPEHFALMEKDMNMPPGALRCIAGSIIKRIQPAIAEAVQALKESAPDAPYIADDLLEDMAPRLKVLKEFTGRR